MRRRRSRRGSKEPRGFRIRGGLDSDGWTWADGDKNEYRGILAGLEGVTPYRSSQKALAPSTRRILVHIIFGLSGVSNGRVRGWASLNDGIKYRVTMFIGLERCDFRPERSGRFMADNEGGGVRAAGLTA